MQGTRTTIVQNNYLSIFLISYHLDVSFIVIK